MKHAVPLPADLVDGYQTWKKQGFERQAAHYLDLAENGQSPRAMVISCCDSRVQATEIFGAQSGDFFLHRNVANLVPPYAPNSDFHGTSAAVEYAVKALKVPHLIVLGHSQCGGVQACYNMCTHGVAAAQSDFEFIGHWLEMLRPAYARLGASSDETSRIVEMGQQGVLGSLENLMSFPFVAEAVGAKALSLHGLWHDIGSGTLFGYNAEAGIFEAQ
ncbi:MAG: carbonic anhydrase [Rhodobiaceae bacterium]|jgi:carbonic anhydrase|nr:carbonic anhydrase [Rhodobiaceae bacterium]MBT5518234.1 carbonic anhydrase [Rhodobiaceae bacterium]MBT7279922.1 carbonic anhydrase [Rhodobiaceae bacterium]MDG2495857.1 carbonic anhydrase [Alphaproteobacteria bacterium]